MDNLQDIDQKLLQGTQARAGGRPVRASEAHAWTAS
jgi:hypothetical protein